MAADGQGFLRRPKETARHVFAPSDAGPVLLMGGHVYQVNKDGSIDTDQLVLHAKFASLMAPHKLNSEKILIIDTTPSPKPEESFQETRDAYVALGLKAENIIHVDFRFAKPEEIIFWTHAVEYADGAFGSGGNQDFLKDYERDTPYEEALKTAHLSGTLALAGTSASAQDKARVGISGHQFHANDYRASGILPIAIDTHIDFYKTRSGENSRLSVFCEWKKVSGAGIPENTGLLLTGSKVEVIGTGTRPGEKSEVVIIDWERQRDICLTESATYDFKTGIATGEYSSKAHRKPAAIKEQSQSNFVVPQAGAHQLMQTTL